MTELARWAMCRHAGCMFYGVPFFVHPPTTTCVACGDELVDGDELLAAVAREMGSRMHDPFDR